MLPSSRRTIGAAMLALAAAVSGCDKSEKRCLERRDLGACRAACKGDGQSAVCTQRNVLVLDSCTAGNWADCRSACTSHQKDDAACNAAAGTLFEACLQRGALDACKEGCALGGVTFGEAMCAEKARLMTK